MVGSNGTEIFSNFTLVLDFISSIRIFPSIRKITVSGYSLRDVGKINSPKAEISRAVSDGERVRVVKRRY